jgi:glutathione peroxidase
MNFYDFKINDYRGREVDLSIYKGKVLLIVNTATRCGFTPQYEGLEKLYEKYHEQGFMVLDFPCNQFMGQAPGSSEQIHETCTLKYKIMFDQFEKIDVNGKNRHPIYQYLIENSPVDTGKRITRNFNKFLVDKEGNVINRFSSTTKPEDIDVKIKELLDK